MTSTYERAAITRALDTSPNITAAARSLGSSRRTLQNRMRHYAIPPGKAGRPRELLPYRTGFDFTTIALVGVAFGLGWLVFRRTPSTVVGAAKKSTCLRGLDVIL